MNRASSHTARRPLRRLIAILLMTIYVVIAMSPLAPAALHSKYISHAVTGECVGDCGICGCSLESRGKSCCCAQKRQMSKNGSSSGTKSCCLPKATALSPAPQKRPCCAGSTKAEHIHNDHDHDASGHDTDNHKVTVLKCGCPCGKGKLLAINGFGSNEIIPFIANERIAPLHAATLFTDLSKRLASRHGDPPDPPPKLVFIS